MSFFCKFPKRAFPYMGLMLLWIILDLFSKFLAQIYLSSLDKPITIIPYFVYLDFHRNTGIAFSILANGGAQGSMLLGVFSIFVVLAFFVIFIQAARVEKVSKWELFILSLIIGGGFSNGLSRLFSRSVIDFIDLWIGSWHFAIVNMADIFLTCAMIAYFYFLLFNSSILEKNKQVEKS